MHEEELMLLPAIVAKLEREETKADLIFKKVYIAMKVFHTK